MSLIPVFLAACLTTEPLSFLDRADIEGSIVRLSDLADLDALPDALRARAAVIEIHSTPEGPSVLSSRQAASRARAALPALTAWLPDGPDRQIHIDARDEETAPSADAAAAAAPAPAIAPGDRVRVAVQVGPVRVERDARALQAGWPGRPLFVRTADGKVLTAMIERER